jgi:membrane protease YdiL (CAAX protease family)
VTKIQLHCSISENGDNSPPVYWQGNKNSVPSKSRQGRQNRISGEINLNENKIPEPLEALIVLISSFFVIISITLLISFASPYFSFSDSSEQNIELLYVFFGIFFFILPYFYAKKRGYDLKLIFRFNPVRKEVILLSTLIGITITIIGDEIDRLIQIIIPLPDWFAEQAKYLVADSIVEWILIISGAIIIAAFAEELLFRGFLQVSLEKKGDPNRAVVLSSIAWTIVHMNPYWAIQIFIIGIIIGFLAWRTKSVIPAIIVHAINNFIALLFLNYQLDINWSWYLLGEHVSPVLLVISIYGLVWSIRNLTNIYKNEPQ